MSTVGGRIAQVDVLRGAALFGILVVNIMVFAFSSYGGALDEGGRDLVSRSLAFAVSALFELKFYLIFSFLFGYSFTLQQRSAQRAGTPFGPRLLRRHLALFLVGISHALLLFHGDILTTYAVLGGALWLLAAQPAKRRLMLAVALVVAVVAVWLGLAWLQWRAPARDDSALVLAHALQAKAAYTGSAAQIVAQHIRDMADFIPLLALLQVPCALAMFLLGQLAGNHHLFDDPAHYRPYQRPVLIAAALIGLPGALCYAMATQLLQGSAMETAALALSVATAPFLAGGVLVLILRLLDTGKLVAVTRRMASAGRMALTHYLLQSVLCALLFHGYGLGLMDALPLAAVLVVAVAIYALQLMASPWWLARYCYGPMEWLLRAATLAAWPAWRR